jgi:CHAT domain-containing protein/Tfp pilus assembly protein PilF
MKKLPFLIIGIISFICVIWFGNKALPAGKMPVLGERPIQEIAAASGAVELEKRGRHLYEMGRWEEAIALLEEVAADYTASGDEFCQTRVLRNLALLYHQLGKISLAEETINRSLNLLQKQPSSAATQKLKAQILEVSGSLEMSRGEFDIALKTWGNAAEIYGQILDIYGKSRNQINQALALRQLGLNPKVREKLEEINQLLNELPESLTKFNAVYHLGESYQLLGNLEKAETVLAESWQIAEFLGDSNAISQVLLSLANNARWQGEEKTALELYEKATSTATEAKIKIKSQLNQLSLLVKQKQWSWALNLIEEIKKTLDKLPLGMAAIDGKINLANSLLDIKKSGEVRTNISEVAELLAAAVKQAKELGNPRSLSYALGNFGKVYEINKQWEEGRKLTEKALLLAQGINAPDIAYQWQWQLGRLLEAEGEKEKAIAPYTAATKTLQSIRSDLAAVSSEAQFSFQESVEPVYRELIGLLLEPDTNGEVEPEKLIEARELIESLQLAELDDFFKDACLKTQPVNIDGVDEKAGILSTIILSDRLAVIAALPGQPLRYYSTDLPQQEIEKVIDQMRQSLRPTSFRGQYLLPAQEIYNWLIRPIEVDLVASNIETLVFIADGKLRNIPMSVLNDGEQFLIEKYSIALTPGLQLLDPKPLPREELKVLSAGLSEARQGFSALPGVEVELGIIKNQAPSEIVLNQSFTDSNFKQLLGSFPFPVVHLATHGEFSSNAEDTFVLTWDDKINANELENLLRNEATIENPIELLVLSACQTALGDNRAALGLAGVAVRAGARTTLGSLWLVSDEATAKLMARFYQELTKDQVRKAEALRRAQLEVLNADYFSHPYYWSAFILVGNWL